MWFSDFLPFHLLSDRFHCADVDAGMECSVGNGVLNDIPLTSNPFQEIINFKSFLLKSYKRGYKNYLLQMHTL